MTMIALNSFEASVLKFPSNKYGFAEEMLAHKRSLIVVGTP